MSGSLSFTPATLQPYSAAHGQTPHRCHARPAPLPEPRRSGGLDRFFQITERGSTVQPEVRGGLVTFFTMAYIVVLNPLIIGTQQDGTGQFLGGGDIGKPSRWSPRHRARRRRHDDPHGRRRELPARARDRPRAQRVRGVRHRQAARDDLGRRHGPRRHRGRDHPRAGADRVPARRCSARSRPSSRPRSPSASACSSRSSASSTPASSAAPAPARSRSSSASAASSPAGRLLVFVVGLLAIIAMLVRKVKGAILIGIVGATVLAIIVEAIAKIGRQSDADGQARQPGRLGPQRPGLPDQRRRRPRLRAARPVQPARLVRARSAFVAALLLVFTLLLADFFDTMGTMVAIGAEAGLLDEDGNPPNTQRDPARRLGRRGRRWRRRPRRNTSYIESAVRRRRGRPHRPGLGRHRRAVPARRRSSRRWSRSSPTRRPRRRWSSSAS